MKHIYDAIQDGLAELGINAHDAPIAPPVGFPCDVGITPEEIEGIDEYTREQARQSEFAFDCLLNELRLPHRVVAQMNEEAAYDERRIFDNTHPNHNKTQGGSSCQ